MNFKEIFKLNVGQVAFIMFAPLLLTPFIGIYGILAFYIFLALWLYYLAIELFPLLPQGHKLNLNRFKFYYFGMLLFSFYGAFKMYEVLYSDLPFDDLTRIVPVLNILILFFLLNCMYFIAKEIILIKDNKTEVNIIDCIGMFISFWLLPFVIGILLIQPTIKSIFEKYDIKKVDEEETEETDKSQEKELINYKPQKYNCDLGELVIHQEMHQPNYGENVFLNGTIAPTGKYKIGFLQNIIVVDGKVAKELPVIVETRHEPKKIEKNIEIIFKKYTYHPPQGELVIEQEYQMPNYGEIAYLNGKPAPTGSYEVGLFQTIHILDGKVSKK